MADELLLMFFACLGIVVSGLFLMYVLELLLVRLTLYLIKRSKANG